MIRVENPYLDTVVVPMIQDMPSMRTMMHRAFDAGAKAQLKKVIDYLCALDFYNDWVVRVARR